MCALAAVLVLAGCGGETEAGREGLAAHAEADEPPPMVAEPVGAATQVAPPLPQRAVTMQDAAPPPADAEVVDAVRQRLQASDRLPDDLDLRIEIFEGQVSLYGTVPTQDVADEVVRTVSRMAGVTRVDNQLEVAAAE